MNTNRLRKVKEIENFSGDRTLKILGKIKPVRKGFYRILDIPVSGDAPKDFIQLYSFGEGRKDQISTWPKYIAKVGKKWYPNESLVEYLLNRIGENLGLNMAKSELRIVDDQLRFLSKYFLKKGEILVHGAQIFSGFLEDNDDSFVHEIEQSGLSRELFTFQFAIKSIGHSFPKESESICIEFVKLLIFDAITGNNDRHFYNWGIVTDIEGKEKPAFSPIFDTARGLFWNYSEDKIKKLFKGVNRIDEVQFQKYIDNSRPKTGWDGLSTVNHFELVRLIYESYPKYSLICQKILHDDNLKVCIRMIEQEFKYFLSKERYILVVECLSQRFKRLQGVCGC
ncbi:MAG: HipA domain-containing protein [Bacteroidia bacterium]